MKKFVLHLSAFLLISSIYAYSQPFKGPKHHFNVDNVKRLLKLTPEQQKQFDDISYKNQQSLIDIKSGIAKNRLDLKKMIKDRNIDDVKILQLIDENSKLQSDMKRSVVKQWLDIYKILNDDQKQSLLKHIGKMIDGGLAQRGEKMNRGWMHNGFKHDGPKDEK